MQREIEALRARVTSEQRPRVFCEEWGKPLIASQNGWRNWSKLQVVSFMGEPGGRSSAESVLARAPEVVVAAWCGAGDRVPLQKIIREPGWQEMPAVRAGRVYCIR
jgi:iron complex transport system substrate-binding protein